ncbi:MAG TPA: zinc ribbon domain-containing protein [Phycisphaerales bacterium]|nr:zinc ribbon domain-containing protein [Phycisphaerales bacterium]HRQ76509.1 zinc ribbon domain-containing protein [Phycisphaerales bacterium]
MMRDEGPSQDDIDRFDSETAYCPSCGAEVYDFAAYCPECGEPMPDGPSHRPPMEQWLRSRWFVVIAIVLILALLIWLL